MYKMTHMPLLQQIIKKHNIIKMIKHAQWAWNARIMFKAIQSVKILGHNNLFY